MSGYERPSVKYRRRYQDGLRDGLGDFEAAKAASPVVAVVAPSLPAAPSVDGDFVVLPYRAVIQRKNGRMLVALGGQSAGRSSCWLSTRDVEFLAGNLMRLAAVVARQNRVLK